MSNNNNNRDRDREVEGDGIDVSGDGLRITERSSGGDGLFLRGGGMLRRVPKVFNYSRMVDELVGFNKLPFEEEGKGVVGSPTISDRIRGVPHEFDFDLYEALYKTESLVFRGINITAHHVLQPGFMIEGGSEENREIIENWSEYIGLNIVLHDTVKSLLIWGNAYFEVVNGDEEEFNIVNLKQILPSTMYVYRTETGEVIGYIQIPKMRRFFRSSADYLRTRYRLNLPVIKNLDDLQTEKKRGWKGQVRESNPSAIPFDANEIIHIKDNDIPGGEYGLSVIEPMLGSLTIYQGMRTDIGVISKRYAAPKILWLVGDEVTPATDEMMDDFYKYINATGIGDDVVMPSWISFNVLGAGEVTMNMEPYLQLLRDDVFAGLSVPEILMGGTVKGTLASATIQLESFSRRIVVIQDKIAYNARKNIFPLVLGMDPEKMTREMWKLVPKIVFRPMVTEEEKMLRAMNLYNSNIISREEARSLLGLPYEPEGHMWIDDQDEIMKSKVTSTTGEGSRGPNQSTGGGGDDKSKSEKPSGERPKNQGGNVGT